MDAEAAGFSEQAPCGERLDRHDRRADRSPDADKAAQAVARCRRRPAAVAGLAGLVWRVVASGCDGLLVVILFFVVVKKLFCLNFFVRSEKNSVRACDGFP